MFNLNKLIAHTFSYLPIIYIIISMATCFAILIKNNVHTFLANREELF